MTKTIEELLERKYYSGSQIINCISHMHLSILKRPDDCDLCHSDVKNQLNRAINANKWLNDWKDDATEFLMDIEDKNDRS